MSNLGGLKMRKLLLAAVAVGTLLVPTVAHAKGASQATITGPGLGSGLRLAGEGQVGGEKLMTIMQEGGFFPSVFLTTPNPMQRAQPDGALGPRYTIVYEMPRPDERFDQIRQDVYPYASPVPVTYMERGQPYFGTERTVGGWYAASAGLKTALVDIGFPSSAPTEGGRGPDAPWAALVGAMLVGLTAATVLAVRTRLRQRPAAA